MLKKEERYFVYRHAYVPEHLPGYVAAVSGANPHLHENYLCFTRKNHLIFIGYPLENRSDDLARCYDAACERFRPATAAIIAPIIWLPPQTFEKHQKDCYYRLDLPLGRPNPAVAYMVRRAEKELCVTLGNFSKEHRRLVDDFLSSHQLTKAQRHIFRHIQHYLKASKYARLIEARKKTTLVAFTIADMGSTEFAFYLFNFRSTREKIPGASDLLFNEMVSLAQSEGKKAINLGLGIHPGIRRFKEKWGGVPFLSYASALVHREPPDLGGLANKL
ncbi:MAG: hypothetical protein PVI06_02275 [Desulfobacterales bacterium]|jgi:hypothetical protein